MRRREFITFVGIAAAQPFVARAQSAHQTPKIGWLKIQGRRHTPDQLKAFREGMKALGLAEGHAKRDWQNAKWAARQLSVELIALNVQTGSDIRAAFERQQRKALAGSLRSAIQRS
jgi:hypothetical protein